MQQPPQVPPQYASLTPQQQLHLQQQMHQQHLQQQQHLQLQQQHLQQLQQRKQFQQYQTTPYPGHAPYPQQQHQQQPQQQHQQQPQQQPRSSPELTACNFLLAVCRSCRIVNLYPETREVSVKAVQAVRCRECNQGVELPESLLRFFSYYGHFIPIPTGVCLLMTSLTIRPEDIPQYVAGFANAFVRQLDTDYSYDVALIRGPNGVGIQICRDGNRVICGGFTRIEDQMLPAERTQLLGKGDVLIGINKDSIHALTFEQQIRLLANAPSPFYLTFRRYDRVQILYPMSI